MSIRLVSTLFLLILAPLIADSAPDDVPSDLAPLFEPPAAYRGKNDGRVSPLRYGGHPPATTSREWSLRRSEIRDRWVSLLGKWPELLPAPRMEQERIERRENFLQIAVRVEVARDVFQPGYLLMPDGAGPFPAVFVPYYDPETSAGLNEHPLRDFGYQLAKRGFVALCLGAPGGDARAPELSGADCQPLFYLAYIGANAHAALAQLTNVDASRIGVVGHSYGGKWAMFAACFYDKYACGVWSDPGIVFDERRKSINYWEPWYLGWEAGRTRSPGLVDASNPRTGAYARMVEEGRDLHEVWALMAPRPFFVSGGSEDPPERWLSLQHAIAVNGVLGARDRVAMSNRPTHDPTPESNQLIYRFLDHVLKRPGEH